MTVSKRARFEVLRRDEHTCQYCGNKAPDVVLQIDHVIPVALGGDDKPGNLVTACKDCNAGKSSIPPGSPLVQSLSAEAAAYALGMVDKMTRFRADLESLDDYVSEFRSSWDLWKRADETLPLPADYENSLFRWMRMGVPRKVFELAIPAANAKFNRERYMQPEAIFPYMAGIVWGMVNEREIDYSVTEDTAAIYTESEAEEKAWDRAREMRDSTGWIAVHVHDALDFVRHHIDGTIPAFDADMLPAGMKTLPHIEVHRAA